MPSLLSSPERLASYVRSLDVILNSAISPNVAYAEIRNDLEYLPHLAIQLKKRMNHCTPLLHLPPEIIMKIMRHAVDVCPTVYRKHHISEDLGWIRLGHICHTLREVLQVIAHRALWAENISVFPAAFHEFLRRSGDCPFSLDLGNFEGSEHYEDAVHFVTDNMSQARVITVPSYPKVNSNGWPPLPAALSGRVFPHLESLVIDFDRLENSEDEVNPFATEETYQLSPMHTPRLQSICFRNFYVPFDWSTLSSLDLGYNDAPITPLPSANQFLNMLRNCRNLKHLGLQYWIPPALTQNPHSAIHLPSLAELAIIDDADRVVDLISLLQFPRTTVLHIELYAGFDERLLTLRDQLRRDDHDDIDGLCFTKNYGVMAIWALRSIPARRVARQLKIPNFRYASYPENLVVLLNAYPLPLTQVVPFGTQIVDSTRLRYLSLEFSLDNNATGYDADTWRSIFSALSGVHTLCVDYIVPGFAALTAPSAGANSQPPILPSLRHLWIADLKRHDSIPPTEQSDFLVFVLARKRAGFGLERVRVDRFTNWRLGESEEKLLQRIRAIVPAVESEVDGSVVYEGWRGVGLRAADLDRSQYI